MMRCNVKGRKEMSLDAFWTQSCTQRLKMIDKKTHVHKTIHYKLDLKKS